jgi:hypothetical protein
LLCRRLPALPLPNVRFGCLTEARRIIALPLIINNWSRCEDVNLHAGQLSSQSVLGGARVSPSMLPRIREGAKSKRISSRKIASRNFSSSCTVGQPPLRSRQHLGTAHDFHVMPMLKSPENHRIVASNVYRPLAFDRILFSNRVPFVARQPILSRGPMSFLQLFVTVWVHASSCNSRARFLGGLGRRVKAVPGRRRSCLPHAETMVSRQLE